MRALFALLDDQLEILQEQINQSADPDQEGLLDRSEYLLGMGFVACQRYLTSTYGQHDWQKQPALEIGPHHNCGEPVARILNAAANYFKRSDDWDRSAVIERDSSLLEQKQRRTMSVIESVTPWCDYTHAILLHELTGPTSRFTALLPLLESWREKLSAAKVG